MLLYAYAKFTIIFPTRSIHTSFRHAMELKSLDFVEDECTDTSLFTKLFVPMKNNKVLGTG